MHKKGLLILLSCSLLFLSCKENTVSIEEIDVTTLDAYYVISGDENHIANLQLNTERTISAIEHNFYSQLLGGGTSVSGTQLILNNFFLDDKQAFERRAMLIITMNNLFLSAGELELSNYLEYEEKINSDFILGYKDGMITGQLIYADRENSESPGNNYYFSDFGEILIESDPEGGYSISFSIDFVLVEGKNNPSTKTFGRKKVNVTGKLHSNFFENESAFFRDFF